MNAADVSLLLPIVLQAFGFDMILGQGVPAMLLVGLSYFVMLFVASLVGAGFGLSMNESRM